MNLFLNNVGIIKDSYIQLDGLTVITGKNSSGKTTVGRVVYSLITASSNPVEAFEKSKKMYICAQLTKIEQVLQIRRFVRPGMYSKGNADEVEMSLYVLASHRFQRFDIEQLLEFLFDIKKSIEELSVQYYEKQLKRNETDTNYVSDSFMSVVFNDLDNMKLSATKIWENTMETIHDDKAFDAFLKDRTTAYLNHEFNKQIKPVKAKRSISNIELKKDENIIVSLKVKSSHTAEFTKDSSFVFPYDRCIFIDNPFVLDSLSEQRMLIRPYYRDFEQNVSDSLITSDDVEDHNKILIDLLMNKEKKNFFDDVEIQKRYRGVFDKINKIVPGEFSKTSDGIFYVDEGAKLSVKNLATGSKMFFIIKKLLVNGLLDDKTVLVLDEPESHLHPEWINKFAEVLVVLIKDVKVNVLLTTHSPNLMLALSVYAKENEIYENSNFYIAEKQDGEYFSHIKCINDNLGEGYSHLSLPLVEMNLKKQYNEGKNE